MNEAALFAGLQIGGLAFFVALAFCGFMALAGLGDVADGRSAHRDIVPTAGGTGWLAGLGFAVSATPFLLPDLGFPGRLQDSLAPFLALVFGIGVLGLSDDAFDLPAKPKLLILLVFCALAVAIIGPVTQLSFFDASVRLPTWLGFLGCVIWVFVVINAVNFFDGANGLMGVSLCLALFALFTASVQLGAPSAALLAGVGSAALLGFLPYNLRHHARIFCGDVGALSIGFLYAGAVLILLQETGHAAHPGQNVILIGPLLILPLLADVLLTLAMRIRSGASIFQPHNRHLFLRMISAGLSPMTVTWGYALLSLACANAVLYKLSSGELDFGLEFLAFSTLCVGLYFFLSRLLARRENQG